MERDLNRSRRRSAMERAAEAWGAPPELLEGGGEEGPAEPQNPIGPEDPAADGPGGPNTPEGRMRRLNRLRLAAMRLRQRDPALRKAMQPDGSVLGGSPEQPGRPAAGNSLLDKLGRTLRNDPNEKLLHRALSGQNSPAKKAGLMDKLGMALRNDPNEKLRRRARLRQKLGGPLQQNRSVRPYKNYGKGPLGSARRMMDRLRSPSRTRQENQSSSPLGDMTKAAEEKRAAAQQLARTFLKGVLRACWAMLWVTFGHSIYLIAILFFTGGVSKFARQYIPEVGHEWIPASLLRRMPKIALLPLKLGEIVGILFVLVFVMFLDFIIIAAIALVMALVLEVT